MNSQDERIQNLESLLEVYGPGLWEALRGLTEDDEEARKMFIAVLLAACRESEAALAPSAAKDRLAAIVLRQCRRLLARQGLGWRGRRQWVAVLRESLTERPDAVLPAQLKAEALRLIPAGVAAADAHRRYAGPRWIMGLAGATAVAGAGIVAALGLHSVFQHEPEEEHHAAPAADLPAPLSNLPVQTVAQFRLKGDDNPPLDHLFPGPFGLYRLDWQSVHGGVSVTVTESPYTASGRDLQWRPVATANLLPPGHGNAASGLSMRISGWNVDQWSADISGSWLLMAVDWQSGVGVAAHRVTALYGVYLPTGKTGLMATWQVRPGQADAFHVAMGAGKVAVQPEIHDQSGKQPPVGLPIQVYDLKGTDPATALHPSDIIPAPFGVMANPTITNQGIVFQGIAGHPDPGDAVNATWYLAPYNGEATELLGPPLDGQPHWAVEAADGKLWWAETTPAANSTGVQVLMAPLIPVGQSPSVPAWTLNGTVDTFRADGRWVMWVQVNGTTRQLVVAVVQGGEK
jgi:hypothetical protein